MPRTKLDILNWLKNKLFLSCKRAAELIDRKQSGNITVLQDMQLRMHTSMCKVCTAYEKQSKLLEELLEKKLKSKENVTEDEKAQLKRKILDRLDSDGRVN